MIDSKVVLERCKELYNEKRGLAVKEMPSKQIQALAVILTDEVNKQLEQIIEAHLNGKVEKLDRYEH